MTTITLPNGNQFNLIQLPTSPGLSQFSMTMIDSVAVVPSPYVPGQNQTQVWPGADAWAFNFTLPKMNRITAAPWRGFMAELRGMQNVFQIGDPAGANPLGVALGEPVTSGTNLTSATSLVTTGWTPSITGQLLAGDYLQTGFHLHQVCEQVNSDSSGNATIQIWPSLRDSPANLSAIVLFNCVGLFRLKANTRAWHSDFTQLVSLSFDAVEVR
jgi:hypothetical protein